VKFDIRTLPKLAVAAYGDRVFHGYLVSYLKSLEILRLLDYIHQNKDLLGFWGEEEWAVLRNLGNLAKKSGIKDIETELMDNIRKYRPDIMDVIGMEPGGKEWLASQVRKLKAMLE